MMEVDGIAETSGFVENIGLRQNIPGRNFNKNYFFVADNVVHMYIKNILKTFAGRAFIQKFTHLHLLSTLFTG